ncbi:uncharacterized protein ARMOST_06707 [Armillaria ostoyae]|uniref:Uncharacterized protein n=1 Tax=Armillaria ostoyae TaxID=47428 RepID=A0A284R3Q2_ARMOS|nr:uncharacterized protein ARMOST_06707 [Armillaria ostoyae]
MEPHLSNALAYIAETLFVWEYLISIDDEVALFWARFNFIALEGSRLSETLETVLKTIVDQILVLCGKLQHHDDNGMCS